MKKITLLFLIAFTTITLQAQTKLMSEVYEYYDGTTWQKSSGTNYEYDANKNVTKESYHYFQQNVWALNRVTTNTYNSDNKITSSIDQEFDESTNKLVNSYKSTYTYTDGKYTESIFQEWNGAQWENDWRVVISYKPNGLADIAMEYEWDGTNWFLDSRVTLTYNANNKLSSDLGQDWVNAQWYNSYKSEFTYNASNQMLTYTGFNFDETGTVFEQDESNVYTLDANGNRKSKVDSYVDFFDEQTITSKYDYTYDMTKLMANYAHPFKDKTGVDYLYEDYPYVNKVLTETYSVFNNDTNSYEPVSGRTVYNYDNALSTGKFENERNTISVYPNPTSNFLSIQNSLGTTINKVIVTDLSGKVVAKANQNITKVDVQNLAKGMYIVQIFSDDMQWQQKFMKN